MIEKTYFFVILHKYLENEDIYFADNNIAINILFSETEL